MDFDKITIDAVSCNVKDTTARKQISDETSARKQEDAQLSQKISNETTELNSRISTIIADGQQTDGNTELIDIRTGADGKVYPTAGDAVRGQIGELKEDIAEKIDNPTTADNNKFPRAKDGNVEWVEQGLPTDEQTANAVQNWLNAHPEATTTVQDGSITNAKIQDKTIDFEKIKYFYDTFPVDSVILELPNNTYFETKGFYSVGDGGNACYRSSKYWLPNSFKISDGVNEAYIKPLSNENNVELIKYGLREGANYGDLNDSVIARLILQFGCVLVFPSGHYYFNTGIDVSNYQLSIKGAGCTFSGDVNTSGNTWLHFPNITNGGYAIKQKVGFVSDIIIVGNRDYNYVKIDRSKTYIAPNEIATVVNTTDTKGLYITGASKINNVSCMFLRYGIFCETSNIFIHDVSAKYCNIGVSIGNDIKCVGVYGSNVGILLQIRGAISSAVQVRGDSIAEHLVQIISGAGIYLSDLDADYCVGSCLKIGNNTFSSVTNLIVNGIHGRYGCAVAYDLTKDSPVTALDLTKDNLHLLPLVSVDERTNLIGAHINAVISNSNPLDSGGNYRTPKVLICGGAGSSVYGVHFENTEGLNVDYSLDSDYLKERARSLSDNADALKVDINTPYGRGTIQQYGNHNSPTIRFTKYVTESM